MASKKIAFITGITGQDGSLLASFLIKKGYELHGLVRWDCVDSTQRLQGIEFQNAPFQIHYGDMSDGVALAGLIKTIQPGEIYNLAALSHVKVSFETPGSAFETNAKGTLNLLEAIRVLGIEKSVRVYQASSAEMFGSTPPPQNEESVFAPCSPYGVSKLAAYWMARTYRDSYRMFIANGILFNHESPVRGEDFVTRKIAKAVAAIEAGQQERLVLGNLDSLRDWGHARDYIEAMWQMLQLPKPDDFVLATGESHSVREFAERAFAQTGVTIEWRGEGIEETGIDTKTKRVLVSVDPALYRPKEVNHLLGDASKARRVLGWAPRVTFDELVSEMVNAERQVYWKDQKQWPMAG